MTNILVERVGGLGGFGLGRSRIESKGEVAPSALNAATQARVDGLFKTYGKGKTVSAKVPDGFSYKISRTTANGVQVITVPESEVPAALRDCVTDRLK